MAKTVKLSASEKLGLQATFLACCKAAGYPPSGQVRGLDNLNCHYPLIIRPVGSAKRLYGHATCLVVYLLDEDITHWVAHLAGRRLCKGDTLIYRSAYGESEDIRWLANLVATLYREAVAAVGGEAKKQGR